jgi:predicted nucleic acid-binding protein
MKVRLETEAKIYIQAGVRVGRYALVWSYMLDYENNDNPYDEKRRAIAPWKNLASDYRPSSDAILARGQAILKLGIKPKDALHIACAISGSCDYFITTDRGLLNKNVDGVRIVNPITFVTETEDMI